MEDALAYCCQVGWQGFNAGWYAERNGGGRQSSAGPAETFVQRAARQRVEEVAPEIARRVGGPSSFDAAQRFMNGGDVVDVTPSSLQLEGS